MSKLLGDFNWRTRLCRALDFIDADLAKKFDTKWNVFVANKPNLNLERSRQSFDDQMKTIEKIRQSAFQIGSKQREIELTVIVLKWIVVSQIDHADHKKAKV